MCFKCQGYGHFQANCPNRRALTIKKVEEIDQIHLETSKEDEEKEEQTTVLAPNVGEMLMLRRILHTMEGSKEEN